MASGVLKNSWVKGVMGVGIAKYVTENLKESPVIAKMSSRHHSL